MTAFYDANPYLKYDPEGGYLQFIRWHEFWRNRVYGYDTTRFGSVELWSQAMETYDQSKDLYSSSSIGASWQLLGPKGVAGQWNGLVSAVYVDTVTDPTLNTILCGNQRIRDLENH